MSRALTILYRDDDVVAVDKPSGLLAHRGWARERVVAMSLARDLVGCHVYPVHRLDRSASGVLLFALHRAAARALCDAFAAGLVLKRYLALVRGVPRHSCGVIDHAIARHAGGPKMAAVTEWRVVGSGDGYAVVEARPLTGRTHQIRRHLKHISHPLIGDVNYGKGEHNRLFRERWGLHRLALHAFELTFPLHDRMVTVQAPVPADLAEVFAAYGFRSSFRSEP